MHFSHNNIKVEGRGGGVEERRITEKKIFESISNNFVPLSTGNNLAIKLS
jgi:hypothetical protein